MTVDFSTILPTVVVAIIGFLIRHSFVEFGKKLDRLVDKQEEHDSRITAVETVLKVKGVDL